MKRKTIDGKRYVVISEDEFMNLAGTTIGDEVFAFIHAGDDKDGKVDPIVPMGMGMFASNVVSKVARRMYRYEDKRGE